MTPDKPEKPQSSMFVKLYEEQPASPVVEWARYANRRNADVQGFGKKAWEQAFTTLILFGLAWASFDEEKAWDRIVWLVLSYLAAIVLLPIARWLGNFAFAFYFLVRDENVTLSKDVAALTAELQKLQTTLLPQIQAKADVTLDDVTLKATANTGPPAAFTPTTGSEFDLRKHIREGGAVVATVGAIGTLIEPFTREVRREGAKKLAHLREVAIHELLNRRVTTDAALGALKRDIEAWEKETLGVLEQFGSVADVTKFRVLGTFRRRAAGGMNAEHNLELSMLWERLERLMEAIRRLDGNG